MQKFLLYCATGFGLGFLPAPGTMGSLLFTVLWWFVLQYFSLWWQIVLLLGATLISYPIIEQATKEFAQHDAKQIIWDEFIGMWISLLSIPLYLTLTSSIITNTQLLYLTILAFVLFRIFDIGKPFPIYLIDQKIKNSWGILMDDIVAGIFAGFCLVISLIFML